jgi:hypothetical protein
VAAHGNDVQSLSIAALALVAQTRDKLLEAAQP